MRAARSLAAIGVATAALATAAAARAADLPDIAGEPASVDVTNTAIFNWHFDNRNDTPERPTPLTRVDDDYGEWLDRFNVQLNWWRLRLGARYDIATYASTPSRAEARDMAEQDLEGTGNTAGIINYTNQYFQELHSRYLDTFYLSKLWLGYSQPGLDVTVGDFYVQLGRGLVFSVRKIDELAIDTTVRGGKIAASQELGPMHVGATLFGGVMNPLRVDEQSGRRLHGEKEVVWLGLPEAGDLKTYSPNSAGAPVPVIQKARPSYLDDRVVGGHVEAGTSDVIFGANGALLFRQNYTEDYLACVAACDPANVTCPDDCGAEHPELNLTGAPRLHNAVRTFSGSVNIPSIAKHGDLYVEVAGQQLRDGHLVAGSSPGAPPDQAEDLSGYAFYTAASARGGPVTVTLEGKHYRRFFPILANIDTNTKGFGAREFDVVAYSQPPRVESIYVEPIGSPDVCVTGGRARVDYRFTPNASVYGWLGRYLSWSEAQQNDQCVISSSLETHTWDTAVGTELQFEKHKSHAFAWVGARLTDRDEPANVGAGGYLSTSFYREGYVRYDLVKHIAGPFSVQAIGFHRRRFEPLTTALPWNEGENYTALQWAPHFAAIFGYEYQTKEGCERGKTEGVCHYFNGGLQWRSGANEHVVQQIFDTVQLFVGQRRGALRCVSGVCRQFPPFEGAKLEVVSRF